MREIEKRVNFLTYINIFLVVLSFILVLTAKIISFEKLLINVGNVEGESSLVQMVITTFVVTVIFILIFYFIFLLTTIYARRKKEIALINLMLSAFSFYSPIRTFVYVIFEHAINIESILTLVLVLPAALLAVSSLIIFNDTKNK